MTTGTEARAAGHALEPYIVTWRGTCLGVVTVWVLILAVYWPTVSATVAKWYGSGTFTHGFLIPPIVLFLAWRQRRAFLSGAPRPALWGVVLLAGAGLVWIIGELAAVLVVQQLALLAIVELVLLAVFGVRATRALAFPLAFLWFAVPVGEFLTAPLQDFTAWFVVQALRLSGVPVLVEGRALTIPTGHWLVAEACSGVRYVIPSVALGVLFAWVTYQSWRRRLAFVLLSMILPMLANGLRAYIIVLLAHYTENRIAVGIDHLIYGWLFFGGLILALFVVGGRWREDARDDAPLPERPWAGAGARHGTPRVPLVVVLVALVAVAPPLLSATWFADVPGEAHVLTAPAVLAPWTPVAGTSLKPRYAGSAAEVLQNYQSGTRRVQLFVAHYTSERQGEELVNDVNRAIDASDWIVIAARPVEMQLGSEHLTVREETMRSRRGQTRVAWTWYWVSGRHTTNPVMAKWLRVRDRLLGQPYNAAAIVLSTEGYEAAQPILQDFVAHCPALIDPVGAARRPA